MKTIVKKRKGYDADIYADVFQSQRDLYQYLDTHEPIFDEGRDWIRTTYRPRDSDW